MGVLKMVDYADQDGFDDDNDDEGHCFCFRNRPSWCQQPLLPRRRPRLSSAAYHYQ